MTEDREFVPLEKALAMLPDGEEIHTFSNPVPAIMLGADWSRGDVIEFLSKHADKIELTGPMATGMGHGLAVLDGERRLFFATRKTT